MHVAFSDCCGRPFSDIFGPKFRTADPQTTAKKPQTVHKNPQTSAKKNLDDFGVGFLELCSDKFS